MSERSEKRKALIEAARVAFVKMNTEMDIYDSYVEHGVPKHALGHLEVASTAAEREYEAAVDALTLFDSQ